MKQGCECAVIIDCFNKALDLPMYEHAFDSIGRIYVYIFTVNFIPLMSLDKLCICQQRFRKDHHIII